MELVKIKILKWNLYNQRRTDTKSCSWFRFENSFFESTTLYKFSFAEKLTWVYLLCRASKKMSDSFVVYLEKVSADVGCEKNVVEDTMKKLAALDCIEFEEMEDLIPVISTRSEKNKVTIVTFDSTLNDPIVTSDLTLNDPIVTSDVKLKVTGPTNRTNITNITNRTKECVDVDAGGLLFKIVDYLNLKLKSKYRHTSKSISSDIKKLLDDGYNLEDFCQVIDNTYKAWFEDEKMYKYLRPSTIFRYSKFPEYLNMCRRGPSQAAIDDIFGPFTGPTIFDEVKDDE